MLAVDGMMGYMRSERGRKSGSVRDSDGRDEQRPQSGFGREASALAGDGLSSQVGLPTSFRTRGAWLEGWGGWWQVPSPVPRG